ncbi:MAG: hypothetical protein EA352_04120 [Gemmatimonadales bacterium]|nr:MAG: hypothetical protein EA352_04120 [Gemmatimonadales bacterium]
MALHSTPQASHPARDLRLSAPFRLPALLAALASLFLMAGCDSDPAAPDDPDPDPEPLQQVIWELAAVGGDAGPGLSATLTLYEYTAEESLARLELADGVPGMEGVAPAHLHAGEAGSGGGIVYFLGALDLAEGAPGESWAVVPEAFEVLVEEDLHANVHWSHDELEDLLAQGDVGANSGVEPEDSELTPPAVPNTLAWELDAVENDGDLLPDGVAGHLILVELDEERTLVEVRLDGGSPETGAGHPAHIHEGPAGEGGGILEFLTPVDGMAGSPGSSWTVLEMTLAELDALDAHVNVHQDPTSLEVLITRGDVGLNGEGTTVP